MIHIAFCCDNNYIVHCATVIASIIDNNKEEILVFHILGYDISEDNAEILRQWIALKHKRYQIVFHKISEKDFLGFPIGRAYVNLSTYFRLKLSELLNDVDKVLYLDCDTIVNGGINELWNTDVSDYAIAGVLDRHSGSIRLYNRLDYPLEYGYTNAGMLLINLKYWRKNNVFKKAYTLAQTKPTKLKNHDQDILNILFYDKKIILDFKYNLLEYYMYTEQWLYLDRRYYPEIIEACKKPVIIHFCMPQKPWHYECINPYKELYYKYRKMTPWPEVRLTHKFTKRSKKDKVKLFLEKLGLYHVERKSTLRRNIDIIEEPDNVLF